MTNYESDQLASIGGGAVISISGGGESETRSDSGSTMTMENLRNCRRRMSMLDPTKYPPLSTRVKPDFSALEY